MATVKIKKNKKIKNKKEKEKKKKKKKKKKPGGEGFAIHQCLTNCVSTTHVTYVSKAYPK